MDQYPARSWQPAGSASRSTTNSGWSGTSPNTGSTAYFYGVNGVSGYGDMNEYAASGWSSGGGYFYSAATSHSDNLGLAYSVGGIGGISPTAAASHILSNGNGFVVSSRTGA